MGGEEAEHTQPEPGMPLRDGRMLRVDGQGIHVGASVYPLDQIQDARIVSPEPKTLGLRVAGAGLVTLVPVRAEDADAALGQLYLLRPNLRPAGYFAPGDTPYPFMGPPPGFPPPPMYGVPPGYPQPGYPPAYGMPPQYGAPSGPTYVPTYVPAYGPPPSFPGYPIVPPGAGYSGSPEREGGVGPWPQGIGEVIGTGFRLYFKRFGGFVALGLLSSIWPALLTGALQVGLLYAEGYDPLRGTLTQPSPFLSPYTNPSTSSPIDIPLFHWLMNPTPQLIGMLIGGGILWLVLMLLFSAWSVAALSLGARDAIAGRPVRVGAAIGGGLRRMWSVLGVQLIEVVLAIALYLVIIVPVIVVSALVGAAMASSGNGGTSASGGSAALAALGTFCGIGLLFLLFVLAFIYLAYRLILATYAAAADHLSPFRALGRAWSLTWRNWWRTVLPLFVVTFAVGLVAAAGGMVQYASIIGGLLIAVPLITAVAQPLLVVMALTVYYDLRLRREGYPSLAMELGLPTLPPPPPPPQMPPMSPMDPLPPTGPAQPDHPAGA